MSRFLQIIALLILLAPWRAAAQDPGPAFTPIGAGIESVTSAALSWGDFDGDGDLDILLNGFGQDGAAGAIYRNDAGVFVKTGAEVGPAYEGNVAWVDFDNDGDLDTHSNGFFSGSETRSALSLNRGDEIFLPLETSFPGSFNGDIAWGDYDNDGDLDVLVTGTSRLFLSLEESDTPAAPSSVANEARLFRNDGAGEFTDIDAGLPPVRASAAAWGDFDNDGDLDILLAGLTDAAVRIARIYKNEGSDTFVDIQAPFVGVSEAEVAWGDYDSDGDLDAFVAGQAASLAAVSRIYRNNGGGQFVDIQAPLDNLYNVEALWADYDNDGDLDLLIASKDAAFDKPVRIYAQENDTSFVPVDVELTRAYSGTAAWGDYDGDGDLDIAFAGEDIQGTVFTEIYRNESQILNLAPEPPSGLQARQKKDALVFSWSAGSDSQTLAAGLTYNLRVGTAPGAHDIAPAMALGDGHRSIVAYGNTNHDTTWTIKGLEPGVYYWSVQAVDQGYAGSAFAAEQTAIVLPPPFLETGIDIAAASESMADWGDYDNDGDLDLAIAGLDEAGSPFAAIYRNDGNEVFTSIDAGIDGVFDGDIDWGDYDNDGDLDLIIAGNRGGDLPVGQTRIYRNDGQENFVESQADIAGIVSGETAWGDFDNDGDLDVVITGAAQNAPYTALYVNEGLDRFPISGFKFSDLEASMASWADYDGDGDLDLMTAGLDANGQAQTLLFTNSDGTFLPSSQTFEGVSNGGIDWGDYDSDGDRDVVVSGMDNGRNPVAFIYNNDHGTFTDVGAKLPGFENGAAAWGDFDNDGDLDLLIGGNTASEIGSRTVVYRNDGGNAFTDLDADLTGAFKGDVNWSDFDRDGDLDVLVTGEGTGFVSIVYRNNAAVPNTAPAAPGGLSDYVSIEGVTFSWLPAGDNETVSEGLTYNLRIGTATGLSDVMSPMSLDDGTRQVARMGNVRQSTNWRIDPLAPGEYYWSVQAVDHGFAGSAFSEERRVIVEEPPFVDADEIWPSLEDGRLSWGDYDGDGDLDIILNGAVAADTAQAGFFLFRNALEAFVDETDPAFTRTRDGDLLWGDFDNDGDLDVVQTGRTGAGDLDAELYENNGGNVEGPRFSVVPSDLTGVEFGDVSAADYDNDGDLDLLITGETDAGPITRLYRNDDIGDGVRQFIPVETALIALGRSGAAWGDYDNDGDPDVILTGSDASGVAQTRLFRNDGSAGTGWTFQRMETNLPSVLDGSAAWGDYDNDGDLDLLLRGNGRTGIYENPFVQQGGFPGAGNIVELQSIDGDFPPLYGRGAAAWGDYDNDGDLDFIVSGALAEETGRAATRLFRNDGDDQFRVVFSGMEDMTGGDAGFADADNDGDLDLLINGNVQEVLDGKIVGEAWVTRLYRNRSETANTAPEPPVSLTTGEPGSSMAFSWQPAADSETPAPGLSYNLRIDRVEDPIAALSPMALQSGKRMVVGLGNANQSLEWTIQGLDPGDYVWSVQSIDHNFAGSPFAAPVAFTVPQGEPGREISRESIDFGTVAFDSTSFGSYREDTLVIRSTGAIDLQVTDMTISGSDTTAFSLIPKAFEPFSLSPETDTTLTIRFTPEREGAHSALLTIRSNTEEATVSLAGAGRLIGVDVPSPAEEPTIAKVVDLEATLSGGFEPSQSLLFYRQTGDVPYQMTPMTQVSASVFRGQIPDTFVTPKGIDYYMHFSDNGVTLSFHTADAPAHLRVRVPAIDAPNAFLPRTYRMFSVPMELETPTIESVLHDDFGGFEAGALWRLLRWDQSMNSGEGAYREYGEFDWPVSPGTAFWLTSEREHTLDAGPGRSTEAAIPYRIRLEPGWNQIGNPFAFDVFWNNVSTDPEGASVSTPVRYDPEGPAEDPYDYSPRVLTPWEGYFVRNNESEPIHLIVNPRGSVDETPRRGLPFEEESDYWIQLAAAIEDIGLKDSGNYIGFAEGTSEGYDDLDFYEAPGIGNHVRLSVMEEGQAFAGNFKPLDMNGQEWDVELSATISDEPFPVRRSIRVSLVENGARPPGLQIYVLDAGAGFAIPVLDNQFEVELSRDEPVRRLRLIVGTEDFAKEKSEGIPLEPLQDRLDQNYPNPFNPETRIRFQIGRPQHVTLDVFNLLGQRVSRLVDEEKSAGVHEVAWDARDVAGREAPSGVYLYRLAAGPFSATRKMLLLR